MMYVVWEVLRLMASHIHTKNITGGAIKFSLGALCKKKSCGGKCENIKAFPISKEFSEFFEGDY